MSEFTIPYSSGRFSLDDSLLTSVALLKNLEPPAWPKAHRPTRDDQFLKHLQHCREFLFSKHADLKIEMRPPFSLTTHAVLTDEYNDRQEVDFGGNDACQNTEWIWLLRQE
jgi:hypothetical protein